VELRTLFKDKGRHKQFPALKRETLDAKQEKLLLSKKGKREKKPLNSFGAKQGEGWIMMKEETGNSGGKGKMGIW